MTDAGPIRELIQYWFTDNSTSRHAPSHGNRRADPRRALSFARTSSDSLRSSAIRSIRPLTPVSGLFGGLGDGHPQAVGLCTVTPDCSRGKR
jgi:hypothetical protein